MSTEPVPVAPNVLGRGRAPLGAATAMWRRHPVVSSSVAMFVALALMLLFSRTLPAGQWAAAVTGLFAGLSVVFLFVAVEAMRAPFDAG